jgi:hypothetical protein
MAAHRATSTESSASESVSESESLDSESLESETLESESESETLGSATLKSESLESESFLTYDSSDATDDTADSIHGITPPRVVVTMDDSESDLESSDESETYHLDPETVYSTTKKVETKTVRYTSKKRSALPLDRPGPSAYPRVHVPVSIISVVVMHSRDTVHTVHVYGDAVSVTASGDQWHDTTIHASDIPAPLADLYTLIPVLWRYAPRRVRLGKNADAVPLAIWSGSDQPGDHPLALKSCYTLYVVM